MVVVSIIAIMVGLAMVSVGGQASREFSNQTEKLFYKFKLIADEAELAGAEFGVLFDEENNYMFLQYSEQTMGWSELENPSKILAGDSLHEEISLSLKLSDEEALDLSVLYEEKEQEQEEVRDYGEAVRLEPNIIFFSDGQLTPFELTIESSLVEDEFYVLKGESFLGISLERQER